MYTAAELNGEEFRELADDLDGLDYVDEDGNPIDLADVDEDEEDDPDE